MIWLSRGVIVALANDPNLPARSMQQIRIAQEPTNEMMTRLKT